MIFGVFLLVVIYLLWLLLVRGALWKLILFFAGWVGVYVLLRAYFPASAHIAITIAGASFSWAAAIPTVICLLAMAHTEAQ